MRGIRPWVDGQCEGNQTLGDGQCEGNQTLSGWAV